MRVVEKARKPDALRAVVRARNMMNWSCASVSKTRIRVVAGFQPDLTKQDICLQTPETSI